MSSVTTETAQYITFKLGDESFALNVAQVREVLEIPQITKVPRSPALLARRGQRARQGHPGRGPAS